MRTLLAHLLHLATARLMDLADDALDVWCGEDDGWHQAVSEDMAARWDE